VTNPTHITTPPGVPFVDLIREFDAPAAAVYKAHTDPELFPRWMLPMGIQLQKFEMDARSGGGWSYAFKGAGTMQMSAFGVFHSVEPDKHFIHTTEFSFAPGHPTLSITRFEDLGGGRSRLQMREIYDSVESRDAAASGMEGGMEESFARLDEMLARSATPAQSASRA
jgi:uncharacterized protein YndB with AHSA1/START domain